MHAASAGRTDLVRLLVEAGADVHIKSNVRGIGSRSNLLFTWNHTLILLLHCIMLPNAVRMDGADSSRLLWKHELRARAFEGRRQQGRD